jgi:KipI family sensor histidine kinase inhibitor
VTQPRVLEAGDSTLLLELEGVIDPVVNARAIGLARSMARRALRGVHDIVPTFRSVAVHFDPLVARPDEIRGALEQGVDEPLERTTGSLIELPVVYGGAGGPDLENVAVAAGMTPAAVIERHAAVEYRVYMLGFLPGFAYMAPVDPVIAVPRRATPRLAVGGGSVGIAASQTGVYPCESPGGWQIIGRTSTAVFDAARHPAALFTPGDRVRFLPVSRDVVFDAVDAKSGISQTIATFEQSRDDAVRMVTVLAPGLLTTIQDEGRRGHQHLGVPVCGAMDVRSHRLANLIAGNDASAATMEITLSGPELRMESDVGLAIAGAELEASLDGTRLAMHAPIAARAGSVLRFGRRRAGARTYLAVAGGISCPAVLGSRSTHVRTRMGGIGGRALRPGDRLALGRPGSARSVTAAPVTLPDGGARLRVLPGPQLDAFPPAAFGVLTSTRFIVSRDSDRMGYRLTSDRTIPRDAGQEMISDVTVPGGVQVPPSGEPILLMADRPTTGGYPQLAVVISADLPIAGQLAPGDWVQFDACSMSQALAALSSQRVQSGADES